MEYTVHSDTVFSLTDFLSKEECQAQILRSEKMKFSAATVETGLSSTVISEVRNNDRVIFDDHDLAHLYWERIRHYLPRYPGGWRAVGLNERFRSYRYVPGQVFRWHRDGSYERSANERSLMTLLLYLNDGYTGGATAFSDFSVNPSMGLALFFEHSCMHEGSEVINGVKYVLRTDIMFRRSSDQ